MLFSEKFPNNVKLQTVNKCDCDELFIPLVKLFMTMKKNSKSDQDSHPPSRSVSMINYLTLSLLIGAPQKSIVNAN